MDEAIHRRLAVDLFNCSWRLLELPSRTREQDDELIHAAHASALHWRECGTPANVSRGEGQCARVYAALGRPEPALHHAYRCLELVRAAPAEHEDWDLASAYEVLARAELTAGNDEEAARLAALARDELTRVGDPDDREIVEGQLAELDI